MSNRTAVIDRPILFSGPMVRAILDGRKTQTRRVIKPQPVSGVRISPFAPFDLEDSHGRALRSPYGAPGGHLWLRETWAVRNGPDGPCIEYQADGESAFLPTHHDIRDEGGLVDLTRYVADRWRPSIHMPRWASRITLEIAGVRVERVADISNGDAYNEGCGRTPCVVCDESGDYDGAACFECDGEGWISERANFRVLWDSINGPRGYSFKSNPWVWVVEFRRV